MNEQSRESLDKTKVIFLTFAIIIAIIAQGYFKKINSDYYINYLSPIMLGEVVKAFPRELILYYGKDFLLLASLVFIGYSASNIFEVLTSIGIFVALGPIISIFRYIIIDKIEYGVKGFLLDIIYIGILFLISLIPFFIKIKVKRKDKLREVLMHILLIVVGVISAKVLYRLLELVFNGFNKYFIMSVGLVIRDIIKLSPILIVLIGLVIFICKAMLDKENVEEILSSKGVLYTSGALCSSCRSPLIAQSKFCIVCGKQVNSKMQLSITIGENEILCNNCHKLINKNSKFCMHCGKQIV